MMYVFLLFYVVQARPHSANGFEGLFMFIINTAIYYRNVLCISHPGHCYRYHRFLLSCTSLHD